MVTHKAFVTCANQYSWNTSFECKGDMEQKFKHGTFARLNPRHFRGLGAWLKPTGI